MFGLIADGYKELNDPLRLLIVVGIFVVTILTINSFWHFVDQSNTLLGGLLAQVLRLDYWILIFGGFFILTIAAAQINGNTGIRNLAAMCFAFSFGIGLSSYITDVWVFPAGNFPIESYRDAGLLLYRRLFFLIPIVPVLAAYFITSRKHGKFPIRLGDLSVKTTLFFKKGSKNSWRTIIVRYWIFVIVPVTLLMQIPVGFEPILSGKIFVFVLPIFVLALFNAMAEDFFIQGFIVPNTVHALNPAIGIFIGGMFFGLLHWGASPDAISGLPQGLIIGFFAWMGAKAVVETGGIGMSVICHMGADVAIFSSNFI